MNKGYKLSKEAREKIRLSKLGSKNPSYKDAKLKGFCLNCGIYIERPTCGRTIIKYCSNKCQHEYNGGPWNKGVSIGIGADNPNWKGGVKNLQTRIRYSTKGREWINSIFERDDYTCNHCSTRGKTLNAHHIVSYKTLFNLFRYLHYDLDLIDDSDLLLLMSLKFSMFFDKCNGITLCEKCHRKIHRQGDIYD